MRVSVFFLAPWRDAMFGMERVVAAEGGHGMALALLGVLVSWWVYVPVHELMHAWGCLLAGGTVTRLEIDEVYGAAVPWALAPFVSLVGDYYELGSIMVSRVAAGWLPDAPSRWRSDDLVLLGRQLFGGGDVTRWTDVAGVSASLLVGTALTFATYAAGAAIATRCGSRPAP